MLINTLYKMVKQIPQIKPSLATPMESERVHCKIEDIEQFYNQFEEILKIGIPAPLVLNVDETGCDEWVDSSDITVLIPSDCQDDNIKIPICRNSKRLSMIVEICADGSIITPGIVTPRKTIELELYESGYTPDKVYLDHQENGFFDTNCFVGWASTKLFPEIEMKRKFFNYGGEVLLIIDGFVAHACDWFLDECSKKGVIPFWLPAHASDQCQPLDLDIFHVLLQFSIS